MFKRPRRRQLGRAAAGWRRRLRAQRAAVAGEVNFLLARGTRPQPRQQPEHASGLRPRDAIRDFVAQTRRCGCWTVQPSAAPDIGGRAQRPPGATRPVQRDQFVRRRRVRARRVDFDGARRPPLDGHAAEAAAQGGRTRAASRPAANEVERRSTRARRPSPRRQRARAPARRLPSPSHLISDIEDADPRARARRRRVSHAPYTRRPTAQVAASVAGVTPERRADRRVACAHGPCRRASADARERWLHDGAMHSLRRRARLQRELLGGASSRRRHAA